MDSNEPQAARRHPSMLEVPGNIRQEHTSKARLWGKGFYLSVTAYRGM